MTAQFAGKVALVTGGSSGIGQATVLAFAREGARVVVAARRHAEGEATAAQVRQIGGEALFVPTDVSQASDVVGLISQVVETYGRLDYVFHNAGDACPPAATAEQVEADWDRIVTTHLKGVWLGMKYAIPQMLRQGGGAIVNMSSVAGMTGNAFGVGPYIAAKHGVVGLTKAVALEYAKMGIRVNAVAPGYIRTPLIAPYTGGTPDGEVPFAQMHPMGRIGTPEEVADAVVWLCSERAAFITGHVLPVDGGFLAGQG
jgi:NAD(P)-dependent dehydrogenase (short-subunit alcohol dehydrogenase family)